MVYLQDNVNATTSKIRWARLNGHLDVVKFLADHGADVTARDIDEVIEASDQ
jgi:ankyrin repeat protein